MIDDNNLITTDDDRQTPSNGRNSSDDISSEIAESIAATVYENDPQRIPSTNSTYIRPLVVNSRKSLPNVNIKHPYQTDDHDPFDDDKRIITDDHVKIARVNRASVHNLNADGSLSNSDAWLRRKSTGNVSVSRFNKAHAQTKTGNQTNHHTSQITFGQNPAHANHALATDDKNQDFDRKGIITKPVLARVSFSNERPLKMCQKEMHVTVKHILVNQKKSS